MLLLKKCLLSGTSSPVVKHPQLSAFQVVQCWLACLLDHPLDGLLELFRVLGTHHPFAFRFEVPAQINMMGKRSI